MSTGTWASSKAIHRDAAKEVTIPFQMLKAMGSLKITVTMFAAAIFLIFVGTLAQDELDLAGVKREYFNAWIARVPIDVFCPITIVQHDQPYMNGLGFYFPGGATVGLVLLINLIAAKATRFSVHAKGRKLLGGMAVTLLGCFLIGVVIVGGHTVDGLQGQPPISYETLWGLLKFGFIGITVALVAYAVAAKLPALARRLVWLAAVVSFLLSLLLALGGESVRLDDPGLRIVWQLLQATIASSFLLVGLILVFGKRGGNVLIHAGVGLLMVGQFVFGDRQIEQRMGLAEGTTTNLAVIEDEMEIALIDTSDPEVDQVFAIPEGLIRRAVRNDGMIDSEQLPCKVKVLEWMTNSQLLPLEPGDENLATEGFGLTAKAVPDKAVGGAMMDDRNIAAAYVQLIDKKSDKPIATLLLSQQRNDIAQLTASMQTDQYESATIDSKSFDIGLRFRQVRKPYEVFLKDVERINYSGTQTPRDYSSRIVITDGEGDKTEDVTWMNNPIRYRGETFYQSRYNAIPMGNGQTVETTGLQVVENAGWVIPYVSCMMVFVGMFSHFGGTFLTFANRYSRGAIPQSAAVQSSLSVRLASTLVPLLFCAGIAFYFARPASTTRSEVKWQAIADLPVQHEGRIKPFDSVARNILQVISKPVFGSVPYVKDAEGVKRSPTEWLLGVMANEEWVRDAEVIRIYAPEVQSFFDLEKGRRGSKYAYNELLPKMNEFRDEIDKFRGKDFKSLDFRAQKMVSLNEQLNAFDLVSVSYRLPPIPEISNEASEEEQRAYFNQLMQTVEFMQRIESGGPPAIIPPEGEANEESLVDAKWQAYGPAVFATYLGQQMGLAKGPPNPALLKFTDVLDAAREGRAAEVNEAVSSYQDLLLKTPLAAVRLERAAAERWLNTFNPTAQGVFLYVIAILLGFASFLFRSEFLRRSAFWLLVGVFIIHTIAIVARIYISGRAPVINLYSSAVFIGWASVLFCLALERIYPIGIPSLVAAIAGGATLSVARLLDRSDTLPVLQAVLDTQFWLSTHVITITIGYAVTFMAGILGICTLSHRIATRYDSFPQADRPKELSEVQRVLDLMTYGVVCFAIFFSFIGTVLGGLWADDSWGRFWGWDPKENGALMIVLWNAILLHARWDKMVGPRGFAILAVIGNVITAWSWFGTNQLGIGLHSYGFTNGVLLSLGAFVGANILFALVAWGLTIKPASSNSKVGIDSAE